MNDEHLGGGRSTSAWLKEDKECVAACPVCGWSERQVVHDKLRDPLFGTPGDWTLWRCGRCGAAWLDPRPTPESIHRAYAIYPTHHDAQDAAMVETLSPTRRLRRALANGYRNWRFGASFQPASKLGVVTGLLFPAQRAVLDRELRYLPRFRLGARVLDIGAGNGKFLAKAREVGWEVVGVEPDPAAVAAARNLGLDVRKGGVESLAPEPGRFDVITMSHVIEHLHNPRQVLECAFSLLKPNGCIYIDTPNIDAFGHKRFGLHWRGLEPPRHLILFNWLSLESLLGDIGFSRIMRHPRTDIYVNLAAISRRIRERRNPEERCRPTANDYLLGWVIGWKTKVTLRDSEFITLVAFKG